MIMDKNLIVVNGIIDYIVDHVAEKIEKDIKLTTKVVSAMIKGELHEKDADALIEFNKYLRYVLKDGFDINRKRINIDFDYIPEPVDKVIYEVMDDCTYVPCISKSRYVIYSEEIKQTPFFRSYMAQSVASINGVVLGLENSLKVTQDELDNIKVIRSVLTTMLKEIENQIL